VFWVTIGLTALAILVTVFATREYKSVIAQGSSDWIGLIIGGTGVTLVTYGLQNSSVSWTAAPTCASLAGGRRPAGGLRRCADAQRQPAGRLRSVERAPLLRRFLAESAVGFVYIPFLTFVGSLLFVNVLGYFPAKASCVIVITTGICMLLQPLTSFWIDKVGPGAPITMGLVIQALASIGLFVGPDTTVTEMVIPLALRGIGVDISLPACDTAGMSAVDAERAGMGAGLMQMSSNIPAALGVALVTSVIGTITAARITAGLGGHAELDELAARYVHAVQDGKLVQANGILAMMPRDSAEVIKRAAVSASSAAITTSMLVLAGIALVGAIFALLVIGRRRTPDYIETTHAVQLSAD
jgi:hypothetical protein